MYYQFTENDIRAFLRIRPNPWKRFLPALFFCASIAFAGWAGLNVLAPKTVTYAVIPSATSTPAIKHAAVPTATPTPAPPTPLPITLPANTFAAADLGISAPITWRVPLDQKTMDQALTQGLIHVDGTSLPGQTGVVAIAGHSSNYPWIKSSYNSVFAPMTKAAVGQVYEINYQNTMYQYVVTKIYQVAPTDLSVLSSDSFTGLHLITCVPVGTSLHRLVVEAKQVFPNPAQNTTTTSGSSFSGQLPSGL